MKIVIAGDICPINRNEEPFYTGQSLESTREALAGADLTLANLECPLIQKPAPIKKRGPNLGVRDEAVRGLVDLGIDVVSLANNHILDHGPSGLETTLAALNLNGIKHFGADKDLSSASVPLFIEKDGTKLAILGFAEREFTFASEGKPGACPLEMNLAVRSILSVAGDYFTVVLLHAGNEQLPYPNPWLQDTCRLMVELGVKVVVCQHSHCIGAYEVHKGGLIVYGQGNFIFDVDSKEDDSWWEGLLVWLDVDGRELKGFEFAPTVQIPGSPGARLAAGERREKIMNDFMERSKNVLSPEIVAREFRSYCFAHKKSFDEIYMYPPGEQPKWMEIGHLARCDAHLEVVRTLYSIEETT